MNSGRPLRKEQKGAEATAMGEVFYFRDSHGSKKYQYKKVHCEVSFSILSPAA